MGDSEAVVVTISRDQTKLFGLQQTFFESYLTNDVESRESK